MPLTSMMSDYQLKVQPQTAAKGDTGHSDIIGGNFKIKVEKETWGTEAEEQLKDTYGSGGSYKVTNFGHSFDFQRKEKSN